MSNINPSETDLARQLFEQAYQEQVAGDVEAAIDLYQQSIGLHPTAEAHTFLGWALSLQHRYDDAIAECLRAIALDDEFGNPYNDIGAYLIALERWDEAIVWLERALSASRYEHRALPYMNLGRIYQHKGDLIEALRAYKSAWNTDKSKLAALHAYQMLLTRLN
jgi:tetratricopeptide (TPR) repeat protein